MPRLLVFSSLFPSQVQPHAGLFIRERMFRVGKVLPLVVVAPVPWFPLQGLLRLLRPHYRPMPPKLEIQEGIAVYHPRFLSVPGLFRSWDGGMMALGAWRTVRRLQQEFGFNIIDAHFAYPDGYAATRLGKWLRLPVSITLRGTELKHSQHPGIKPCLIAALRAAQQIFSVSSSLKQHAVSLDIPDEKIQVVGNGVDLENFYPEDKQTARQRLGLPPAAPVLITVGGLVERKGFHRVIDCLPALREHFPSIQYLIVGGPSPEGDMRKELEAQVKRLDLGDHVRFLGAISSNELRWPLSAADVFVLATRNEGWANVILEAMGCGLPVIATDVGGNREVINHETLGQIVPFGDQAALTRSIEVSLRHEWDHQQIQNYAAENSWSKRVDFLVQSFKRMCAHQPAATQAIARDYP